CQSEEVRVVLGLDVAEQSAQGEASAASSLVLKEFCEIGEALARANDPEHYPTALKEYEGAVAQISQHIGPRGLSLIQASIAKNIRAYEGIPGNLLRAELISEEALRTSFSDYGERLFEQNLFAKRCPEPVQEVLKKAYAQITGGQVSTTAINIFATEVIPALGFHCGCVYLVDKNKNAVVPMLRLGDTDLNRFRPINISDSAGNPHPISEALTFTTPIIQENVFVNSDQVTHITGTFGNDTKTGVLYLEMSPSLSKRDRAEPLQLFKAAKQCLNDCLNLR
ncbi:MAG: hypothetical protein DCC75_11380, partial [Proteobacteria bacterium]